MNAEIVKVDSDKRLVFGWATVTEQAGQRVTDTQGDQIGTDVLEQAAYSFVLHSREAGHMHERTGVGKLVESVVFTQEKQRALGIALGKVGWWVGFHIDDDTVWARIKAGELSAFSIHGTARRRAVPTR